MGLTLASYAKQMAEKTLVMPGKPKTPLLLIKR
jgi:hypothetical protein